MRTHETFGDIRCTRAICACHQHLTHSLVQYEYVCAICRMRLMCARRQHHTHTHTHTHAHTHKHTHPYKSNGGTDNIYTNIKKGRIRPIWARHRHHTTSTHSHDTRTLIRTDEKGDGQKKKRGKTERNKENERGKKNPKKSANLMTADDAGEQRD